MFKPLHSVRTVSKVFLMMWLLVLAQLANAQRPEPPPIEERRYEDFYTFKYGASFTQDPWTWGYTKEFAERFRMPEQWIEPEMKGILAIAFRVSDVGQPVTCGLNGREESCWPQLVCQFDIYYDNRIKLPWIAEIGARDNLLNGISSQAFTWQRSPNQETRYKRGPNSAEKSLYLMRTGFDNAGGQYRQFPVAFTYYDQEFSSGVGLIGIVKGGCPNYSFDRGDYWLDFFVSKETQEKSEGLPREQLKKNGLVHEALVPESFMKRVNAAREAGQQANEQVMKRLMYELQQRKSGQ
jgi:hypothetical protein